jgi:hypothetical protein
LAVNMPEGHLPFIGVRLRPSQSKDSWSLAAARSAVICRHRAAVRGFIVVFLPIYYGKGRGARPFGEAKWPWLLVPIAR